MKAIVPFAIFTLLLMCSVFSQQPSTPPDTASVNDEAAKSYLEARLTIREVILDGTNLIVVFSVADSHFLDQFRIEGGENFLSLCEPDSLYFGYRINCYFRDITGTSPIWVIIVGDETGEIVDQIAIEIPDE
ncbi:MAG: hypothetical protein EPO32_01480 [Anaerolineae bacterium]|nr:MAG: hypothetical protein EPO32_01480 [Anaerolineae bacterium]